MAKHKKIKSILSLGGIAKGRKVGVGSEREYVKKKVSRKIATEGLKKRFRSYQSLMKMFLVEGIKQGV